MSVNAEYKSFITALGIKAQAMGIPGVVSSPAWLTRALKTMASRKNPALVEQFIRNYGVDYTRADRCTRTDTPGECARKYGTLNAFFTRSVRGISIQPGRVVSPADCKAVLFDSFPAAGVWVKGRRWSLKNLLGSTRKRRHAINHNANHNAMNAVGIFRLRPLDYHRFHSPVAGVVSEIKNIAGGYLTVDPAVVTSRDVFTENHRMVVRLETSFGSVFFVAVGAAGVGAIRLTKRVGDPVSAGEDLGHFAFGGSTVIVVLPRGVSWGPRDIVAASRRREETYLTVGQALV